MFRAIIAIIIMFAAGLTAYYLIVINPAHTKKKTVETKHIVAVNTTTVTLDTYPVKIEVMGQVSPAREAALKSRVSGEVINVSDQFIPGSIISADDEILQIDEADYLLDIKVKKAALRQARSALKLEQGLQAIARDELKIIEQSTGTKLGNTDLALRKPQLEQARANVAAAAANLEVAELNLERTKIIAPFNALIAQRNTDLGNIVSPQDTLARLVSTDEYWIGAEIPVHNLRWLTLPKTLDEPASKALIKLDGGRGYHYGSLLKMTGSLGVQSRLANIIISVPDPLLLKPEESKQERKAPLVLGDYVHITIFGRPLENAARIPVKYIRNKGNIWLERNGKLVVQPILIAYEDRHFAYVVKGIKDNDNIITSNIITPINGMDIAVQNDGGQD